MSASFFIGARCQPYNDDYMKCKTEASGKGELDCLREGRKVTRCATSVYVYPEYQGGWAGDCGRGWKMGKNYI